MRTYHGRYRISRIRWIPFIIGIALGFACIQISEASTHERVNKVESLTQVIQELSEEYSIDPSLIQAMIEVESMYRTAALSSVGARGLMQVRPSTAEWIAKKKGLLYGGSDTLYDVKTNVRIGTAYLSYLIEKFDHVGHAVMAYNLGPTALTLRLRRGGVLPDTYVGKVTATYLDILIWKGK